MKGTERAFRILFIIYKFIDENKIPPTYREIQKALGGGSLNSISGHVNKLTAYGFIDRQFQTRRTISIS